jgi:hypothetical protein
MFRALSHRSLFVTLAIALAPFALQAQATACKDGTMSAATGRGACSGHGGVDKQAQKAAKAEAKAAKPEAKATSKAAKADVKADAKEAKIETKSTTKAAKSTEKAASKAVSSDVRETGKVANATATPTRTKAANTDPTDATAKCKDGTYSHAATHRGACSRHGGVAEWLKS